MTVHSEPFVLFHIEVGNRPIRIAFGKEIEVSIREYGG